MRRKKEYSGQYDTIAKKKDGVESGGFFSLLLISIILCASLEIVHEGIFSFNSYIFKGLYRSSLPFFIR
jgi:hypothetical protein